MCFVGRKVNEMRTLNQQITHDNALSYNEAIVSRSPIGAAANVNDLKSNFNNE